MGGSGSKTTGGSVTYRSIPGVLKPYVTDILGNAQKAYGQVNTNPYPGEFYAPVNPAEFNAAQLQGQVGERLGTTTGQSLIDLGQSEARGDYLDPTKNPYLMPQIDATTAQIMRQYGLESKSVAGNAITQGAYGGDRGMLAQSDLAGQTNRAIADASNSLLFQNYMAERQNQQNAGNLIQSGVGLNLLGPSIQGQAAADTRNLNQVAIDEALAKFNEANTAPFRGLEQYANLVYGSTPTFLSSTTDETQKSKQATNWLGAILGALSGSSLLSAAKP